MTIAGPPRDAGVDRGLSMDTAAGRRSCLGMTRARSSRAPGTGRCGRQGTWLAWMACMGIATETIEMRAPEEIRERLHELVKAAPMVMVLTRGEGERGAIDGRPMALVRTDDDTTMYVAASLEVELAAELARAPAVTVVVPGAACALFTAEARISRDRRLLDEVWSEAWNRWSRGKSDPSIAIVVLSPLEGSYWEARDRRSYVYRLPVLPARCGQRLDGAAAEFACTPPDATMLRRDDGR
jgi:general stress protein 26